MTWFLGLLLMVIVSVPLLRMAFAWLTVRKLKTGSDSIWETRDRLIKSKNSWAIRPLISALGSNDSTYKSQATQILGELGDSRAVVPLLTVLKDEGESLRMDAVVALGKLGDPRGIEPLVAALMDKKVSQDLVIMVLNQIDPNWAKLGMAKQTVPVLLQELMHPGRLSSKLAARDLEYINAPESKSALEKYYQGASLVAKAESKRTESEQQEKHQQSDDLDQPVRKEAKPFNASDYWERAIASAENGRHAEALEEFQCAIEMNPDYYISVIQPRSARARGCWEKAVERYVRDKDPKANASKVPANCCSRCAKDIGTQWHYEFESISFARTVGAQCPECGLVLCRDDLGYGPDKNYEPCPNCNVHLATLTEGPAYSSMVEQARRERHYRGHIKEPSFLGRIIETG